jgi:hypothetical protein
VQLNHPHLAGLTIKEKCKQTARKPNKGRLKKTKQRPSEKRFQTAFQYKHEKRLVSKQGVGWKNNV